MSAALAPYLEKLDVALADKNVFTDYLNIAEQKTGLPKRNIVLGKFNLKTLFFSYKQLITISFSLCQMI